MTYGELKAYLYIIGFTPAITRYEYWVKENIRIKFSTLNNEIIVIDPISKRHINTTDAGRAKEFLDEL